MKHKKQLRRHDDKKHNNATSSGGQLDHSIQGNVTYRYGMRTFSWPAMMNLKKKYGTAIFINQNRRRYNYLHDKNVIMIGREYNIYIYNLMGLEFTWELGIYSHYLLLGYQLNNVDLCWGEGKASVSPCYQRLIKVLVMLHYCLGC